MDVKKHTEEPDKSEMLDAIKKQSQYAVPADYFDFLPADIMKRVSSNSEKRSPFFMLRPAFGVSILVLLACVAILLLQPSPQVNSFELTLTEHELEYVIENPDLFGLDYRTVSEEYISANTIVSPSIDFTNVSDDEVKSFLESEADLDYIINEY